MEHHHYGAQKRIWRMSRNCKRPINKCTYSNKNIITPEEWENHIQRLYDSTELPLVNYEADKETKEGSIIKWPIKRPKFTKPE